MHLEELGDMIDKCYGTKDINSHMLICKVNLGGDK